MKKTVMIFAAVAAVIAAVSCEKAASIQDPAVPGERTVSFVAGAPETRVAVNGLKFNWQPGDVISVCSREKGLSTNVGRQFTTDITSASASATFKGEIPDTVSHVFAAYPYSTIDHWNKGAGAAQVYIGFNNAQTAVQNGCDPKSMIMCAAGLRDGNLKFSVVSSFLKFSIDADSPKITKVTVKEAARPWIHLHVDKAGFPLGADVNSTLKDVTLSSSTALATGDYYIGVFSEAHPEGLTIIFTLDDNTSFVKTTPAITLERGTVYPIGTVRKPASIADPFKVGDVYTEGTQKAVVFSVDGTGTTAIAITVDRRQLHWAESEDNMGATNQTKGETNMATIKAYLDANPTAQAPAYSFCVSKGEGWYLPSQEEFKTLVGAYEDTTWDDAYSHRATSSTLTPEIQAKRAAFDKILTDNGGAAMNAGDPTGNGDAYWTSTEYSATSSYPGCAIQVRTGRLYVLQGADAAKKTKNGWVRCAKKITK